jgi:hypothetical protein
MAVMFGIRCRLKKNKSWNQVGLDKCLHVSMHIFMDENNCKAGANAPHHSHPPRQLFSSLSPHSHPTVPVHRL